MMPGGHRGHAGTGPRCCRRSTRKNDYIGRGPRRVGRQRAESSVGMPGSRRAAHICTCCGGRLSTCRLAAGNLARRPPLPWAAPGSNIGKDQVDIQNAGLETTAHVLFPIPPARRFHHSAGGGALSRGRSDAGVRRPAAGRDRAGRRAIAGRPARRRSCWRRWSSGSAAPNCPRAANTS